MADPVVRVRDLQKTFGDKPAVRGVSFDVPRGEICALLGPNGAGKTTTLHLLLGVVTPTAGSVHLHGLDIATHRRAAMQLTNFMAAYVPLPFRLKVRENLAVFADLYGVPKPKQRIAELAGRFGIEDHLDSLTMSLSSGQQTLVYLAKALLNRPALLVLDEPTAHLDPLAGVTVRRALTAIAGEEGTTVLITSHNMRDIEHMCDRVLFLRAGCIEAEGSPAALVAAHAGDDGDLEDVFVTLAEEGGHG